MRLALPAALLAFCASSVASAQAPPLPGAIAFASNRASNIWAADLMVSAPRAKTVNLTRSLESRIATPTSRRTDATWSSRP
jgi:hypothetical protein